MLQDPELWEGVLQRIDEQRRKEKYPEAVLILVDKSNGAIALALTGKGKVTARDLAKIDFDELSRTGFVLVPAGGAGACTFYPITSGWEGEPKATRQAIELACRTLGYDISTASDLIPTDAKH